MLAQAEDHDRIAGDLNDHVIQELFALGMKLQGQAARGDPATAALEKTAGPSRSPRPPVVAPG
jgi:signal transduction histidine kinase